MRPLAARAQLAAAMSERELDEGVRALARGLGLVAYHTLDSRGSSSGFPDWVIAGRGGVIFAECKSAAGRLRPDQERWRDMLLAAGARWYLWRPADLTAGEVGRVLQALALRAASR